MDMEEVEKEIEPLWMIKNLGFQSYVHFYEFVNHAVHGMNRFGNSFVQKLATALDVAELVDACKIINVWYQDCEQHGHLYKIYLAKEKAKSAVECGI